MQSTPSVQSSRVICMSELDVVNQPPSNYTNHVEAEAKTYATLQVTELNRVEYQELNMSYFDQ